MRKPDEKRILELAKGLAEIASTPWKMVSSDDQRRYIGHAEFLLGRLAEYDSRVHGQRVRDGQKAGSKPPGRPRSPKESDQERRVRALLAQKATTRTIRAATGVGNSKISRIRSEMEAARVSFGSTASGGD